MSGIGSTPGQRQTAKTVTGKKVFISYCHQQREWVLADLVPCLRAGGVEILIDQDRFAAAKALIGQMDALQDSAEATLAIFSPDYLASTYCRHEFDRAVARAPDFIHGITIPVLREPCELPAPVRAAQPLYIDLTSSDAKAWSLLIEACAADLGCSAPHWL